MSKDNETSALIKSEEPASSPPSNFFSIIARNDLQAHELTEKTVEILPEQEILWNPKAALSVFKNRRAVIRGYVDRYTGFIDSLTPEAFIYFSEVQKIQHREALRESMNALVVMYSIDEAEDRKQHLASILGTLKKCKTYLEKLSVTPEDKLAPAYEITKKRVESLLQKSVKEQQSVTTNARNWITQANDYRLFWVWSGSLLGAILDLLPTDFFNYADAKAILSAPWPVSGMLSFIFLYSRLMSNLVILLKHTFAHKKMTADEQLALTQEERFDIQWDARKFTILSDALWGTSNIICFFILNGSPIANALIAFVMIVDFAITYWQFKETQRDAKIEEMDLKDRIQELENQLARIKDVNQKAEISRKIDIMKSLRDQSALEWKYKVTRIRQQTILAACYLVSYPTMAICAFLLASGIAVLSIVALASALHFTFMSFFAALATATDIMYAKEMIALKSANFKNKREGLTQTMQLHEMADIKRQNKIILLEMKTLVREIEGLQRKAHFHRLQLIQQVTVTVSLPVIMFISLIFLPAGVGIALIVAALTLAFLSNLYIKHYHSPKADAPASEEFNAAEFDAQYNELSKLLHTDPKDASLALNETLVHTTDLPAVLAPKTKNPKLMAINSFFSSSHKEGELETKAAVTVSKPDIAEVDNPKTTLPGLVSST